MKTSPQSSFANQRILHWLERLEQQIEDLLLDLECQELHTRERLDLAAKYLTLLQRFLTLAQKIEQEVPSNSTRELLESLRESMRGAWPLELTKP